MYSFINAQFESWLKTIVLKPKDLHVLGQKKRSFVKGEWFALRRKRVVCSHLPVPQCEKLTSVDPLPLEFIIGTSRIHLVADEDVCKVSIVGIGMRSQAGIAAKMFDVLAREGINIKVITTSEIKISVLIDRKYMELAVQALHDAFELEKAG